MIKLNIKKVKILSVIIIHFFSHSWITNVENSEEANINTFIDKQ